MDLARRAIRIRMIEAKEAEERLSATVLLANDAGLSWRDIAEIMGKSPSSVYRRYYPRGIPDAEA